MRLKRQLRNLREAEEDKGVVAELENSKVLVGAEGMDTEEVKETSSKGNVNMRERRK